LNTKNYIPNKTQAISSLIGTSKGNQSSPNNWMLSIGPTKRKISPGSIDFDSIISQDNGILMIYSALLLPNVSNFKTMNIKSASK
jgi:hypothetical protein